MTYEHMSKATTAIPEALQPVHTADHKLKANICFLCVVLLESTRNICLRSTFILYA